MFIKLIQKFLWFENLNSIKMKTTFIENVGLKLKIFFQIFLTPLPIPINEHKCVRVVNLHT
jgi:hypothetical protein